jgi:hypothetical protein
MQDGEFTTISFSIKTYPSKREHEMGDEAKHSFDETGSVTSADIALGDHDVERTESMEADDVDQTILRARLTSMDRLSSAESAARNGGGDALLRRTLSGENLLRRTGSSGKLLPISKVGPLGNISFAEATPEQGPKITNVPKVDSMH